MKHIERPSILAVGLSEIFDTAGDTFRESQHETPGGPLVGGELSGRSAVSRFGVDAGMLRWMIYSSNQNNPSGDPLEARMTGETMGELISDAGQDACDDSSFGMGLDGSQTQSQSVADDGSGGEVSFVHASTAKRAVELLRALRFDLLVTSDQLPDMAVSQLVTRIRAVRPWQKWALVAADITPQTEIAARSLGAAAVFDAPADLQLISELAFAVSHRTPARMAVGAGDSLHELRNDELQSIGAAQAEKTTRTKRSKRA